MQVVQFDKHVRVYNHFVHVYHGLSNRLERIRISNDLFNPNFPRNNWHDELVGNFEMAARP